MRIRNDYVPRGMAKKGNQIMVTCPRCNQPIPADELDEHMRIELLDPMWKEQKAKSDLRSSTTNLSTSHMPDHLKRLASQRSDVFDGVTGQPISEEEAARRKRAALSYDGQPQAQDLARMNNMNISEQIKQIQQKYTQN
jgi:splicing factor 3A subunit 1